MSSPLLARPIYTYQDCVELLNLMEAFAARDRNNPYSEMRAHCNTLCDCQPDVTSMCLGCQAEGALADVRCLLFQWQDQMTRQGCNCPRLGGKPEHCPSCLLEQSEARAEMARPA